MPHEGVIQRIRYQSPEGATLFEEEMTYSRFFKEGDVVVHDHHWYTVTSVVLDGEWQLVQLKAGS